MDTAVLDALDVPWGGTEEGWLLVGWVMPWGVSVQHAVQSGPGGGSTPYSVDFDRERLAAAVLTLRRQYGDYLVPVGVAHSHPPGEPAPSPDDLRADREWIADSPDPFVFCIVCGGLHWYLLRAGWTDYERVE